MKIIADQNIPFLKNVAENFGEVQYLAGTEFTNERIKDADVLIVRTVAHMNETLLKNTNVKLICSATIGYDHIDTDYCDANNIVWKNAPGCNSGSVMQYIVASLIVISRKHNFNLKNKTIGIVGVGNVGEKVAIACRTLGMRVLLNDPIREAIDKSNLFVSLKHIQAEADIITFHSPLTKDGEHKTYHLANENFFWSLAKKPIIINSARGGIVDTKAIKAAKQNSLIEDAIIDCWENEPTIDLEYMQLAAIATPHIAGYSADGKANATRMSLDSVANFFDLDKASISEIREPQPTNRIIDLNKFENSENRIYDAILETYNPSNDFERLKNAPDKFKLLRNEYPLRREFRAYTLANATEQELRLWQSLANI